MKISNKLQKITGSLIILGILVMPFSSLIPVQKAEAQSVASGYISTIGPLSSHLPGCISEIGSGISSLFSGTSGSDDILNGTQLVGTKGAEGQMTFSLNEVQDVASAEAGSIPVNDTNTNTKLDTLLDRTSSIQKSTSAVDQNQNCLNAIGKSIIKLIIQKMTLSIVNWIQTGYNGAPTFVQSPGKFFGDIAKNQILGFGLEINDSSKYPFAKSFMQSVAGSFNNTFANNAQYSLDKMIKQTNPESSAISFNNDFSQGGWGAWDAMTQVPANNPLGFQLMASNELGKRLDGTSESAAQEIRGALQQANGYLSPQVCTDPKADAIGNPITKEEDDKAKKERESSPTGPYQYTLCKNWETETPGSLIGHVLTKSMDDNENSLLSASTLNDAIAAIADAAIAHFSNGLMTKGLAQMDTDNSDYSGYNTEDINSSQQTQTDFSADQIANSTWLQQNPNFNIRTDLNQALIDEQRTYISKLESYDKALNDPSQGEGLITSIYKLDYCIPGPHPGWEDDARNTLSKVLDAIPQQTLASIGEKTVSEVVGGFGAVAPAIGSAAGLAIGASIGTAAGPIGSVIGAAVGVTVGLIINYFKDHNQDKALRAYYALSIGSLTGIHVDYDEKDKTNPLAANLESGDAFVHTMNTILERYIDVMHRIYLPEYLPAVAPEAAQDFLKIPGYQQIIKDNEAKIATMQDVITRLENLKQKIDDGSIPSTDFDNPTSDTMTEFVRLSNSMVTGDDIATVDNLYKETVAESNHVLNDLLEGPYGCENDPGHFPVGEVFNDVDGTQRMTYYPLMAQGYNPYPRGTGGHYQIGSGCTSNAGNGVNGKPCSDLSNKLQQAGAGPGFESYVGFYGTGKNGPLDNLDVSDLFPIHAWSTSVGRFGNGLCDNPPASWTCAGTFEKIIGIY